MSNITLVKDNESGILITINDFVHDCIRGHLIDDDGHANYSDGTHVYKDTTVYPSDIIRGDIEENYSHIMWYNK